MPPRGIDVQRRGIAIPRAGMAENRRGSLRTRQGMAIPRQVTVTPRAVENVPRQGIANAPLGCAKPRGGRLTPPYGIATPSRGPAKPWHGMSKPRRGLATPPVASREELASIASALPRRLRRRFEGEERLLEIPAAERADDRLLEAERAAHARRLEAALDSALRTLSSEDQLSLAMRYRDGVTVRQIAATLRTESRLLYRRIEKCLRRLRSSLEAQLM